MVDRVAGLEPGMPLGPSEQLAVQRRLLALGVFQRAALRPIPGQDSGDARGYVLDLAEAPTGAFGFGLGWDTVEHLRVSASWSEINFLGRAGILAFQGRFSDRQRALEVSYRETGRVGLIGFPNWTSVYRTEEYYPSFDLLRRGMWIQVGDLQARPWRRLLRYDYQIVDSNAPDEILSDLERDQQNVRLTSLTPILEWDTRNDVFTPRRGTFASVQLQVAFEAFLGEAAFEKLSASVARFEPLLGGVLAASARGGVIWPRPSVQGTCDVVLDPAGCDNLAVPIAVRYFGGGRISHRAFATDLLGVPGKTLICPSDNPDCAPTELDPVGGAALGLGEPRVALPDLRRFRRRCLRRCRQRLGRPPATCASATCAGGPGSASGSRRRSARSGSSTAGSSIASRARAGASCFSRWATRSDLPLTVDIATSGC